MPRAVKAARNYCRAIKYLGFRLRQVEQENVDIYQLQFYIWWSLGLEGIKEGQTLQLKKFY